MSAQQTHVSCFEPRFDMPTSDNPSKAGIWLAGNGRRARHILRPYTSCHGLHSIYLDCTGHGCQYNQRQLVTQKRNLVSYMPNGQFFSSRCTSFDHRIRICRKTWCTDTPDQRCMDGYSLSAISYFPNWSMGLLQSLTHCRNWRKHFKPSGINCYLPFKSTGTSLRNIECSLFGIRD
jgi:hypothetical protein